MIKIILTYSNFICRAIVVVTAMQLVPAHSNESTSLSEKDDGPNSEQSQSHSTIYDETYIPPDQDMYFSDRRAKVSKDRASATWQSKLGKADVTVSVDNVDPNYEWKSEVRKSKSPKPPKENGGKNKDQFSSQENSEKNKSEKSSDKEPSARISIQWSSDN